MKQIGNRKYIRMKPSKLQGTIGGVMGCIFVLIGIFEVIPTFGLFGVLWTGVAVLIASTHLYSAFSKNYKGPEIYIEDETVENFSASSNSNSALRLTELRSLYDQRLITQEEYEEKRKEIMEKL